MSYPNVAKIEERELYRKRA